MAPPFHAKDDGPPPKATARSIYTFPLPSTSVEPRPSNSFGAKDGAIATSASMTAANGPGRSWAESRPPAATSDSDPSPSLRRVCSPVVSAAASLHLRRRLLLPALAAPALLLTVPPLAASVLALAAGLATGTRDSRGASFGGGGGATTSAATALSLAIVLASTALLVREGRRAIERHAPSEREKRRALAKCEVALPFWSFVASTAAFRTLCRCVSDWTPLGGYFAAEASRGGGWLGGLGGLLASTAVCFVRVAGACAGPALGWAVVSLAVVCRYAGPFFPIVRCSSTPLRTNPFDATLQRLGRNFTSKDRFLDMIADGLDRLSAPSSPANPRESGKPNLGQATQSQTKTTPFSALSKAPRINPSGNATIHRIAPRSSPDGILGRLRNFLASSSGARYSRPGLLSILAQVLAHAVAGHVFARAFVLPTLPRLGTGADDAASLVVSISCLLAPVLELLVGVGETELRFDRYSLVGSLAGDKRFRPWRPVLIALLKDVIDRARTSIFGIVALGPIVVSATAISLLAHLGPLVLGDDAFAFAFPSFGDLVLAVLVSYLATVVLVSIAAFQDVLTRWAVCAPGTDVDVLMSKLPPTSQGSKNATPARPFLSEDLLIQSILMGDGSTVERVITPPGSKTSRTSAAPFINHQEDEIMRNGIATASFAEWVKENSTTCSGKLCDDILRMCLLESIGGGGIHFGDDVHSAAARKRLDLSAVGTSPGGQPIVVPVVRALCAFAGGIGDVMSQIYRQVDTDGKMLRKNNSVELWKLPPGSLNAVEYAIVAAARLAVMNSVKIDGHGRAVVDKSKRHERLSLLLPCILQSAFELQCGINAYALATANAQDVDLTTFETNGKGDGLAQFIVARCPRLCPAVSACRDSAKMALKTLLEVGDRSLEDTLLRRKWKDGMQQWLVGLNCEGTPPARITN
ncbi:hypothetical protein ACHAWF_012882 [Thalassiosira exigua]